MSRRRRGSSATARKTPRRCSRYSTPPFPNNTRVSATALTDARDYMGFALAETWKRLSPDFFTYQEVAETLSKRTSG